MIRRFPGYTTRAVVTGGTGPRRDTRMTERGRDPSRRLVTGVAGGYRVGPTFVARRDAA